MRFISSLIVALFVTSVAFAGGFAVDVTNTQTPVAVTSTSTKVVEASPERNYLLIQNTGATAVIVKFGSVQSANEGVVIAAGGNYEPIKGIRNAMWIKTASGSSTVQIVEGN